MEASINRQPGAFSAVLLLLGPLLSAGCGGQQSTVIEFEPILIIGGSQDDPEEDFLTAAELFFRGNELLTARSYEEAARYYGLVIEHFPDSEFFRASLYNLALCHEGLDQWEGAALYYEMIVERWPGSRDATDALYRWAEGRAQLGDWEGVIPLMERALRRARLTLVDQLEAHLRWANAALEMRDYPMAEQHFRSVLRLNRQAESEDRGEQPLESYHPIIMQTNFGLARTYHELFSEIRLVLPERVIHQALVDKAQLLEQARESYLNVVRAGHPYWSPAAGYMIGQLYEDFFLDVLACEVPSQFDAFTVEVYFEELRTFLDPVIRQSLSIYQGNLSMAERMGTDSEWVDETQQAIERINGYLHDPEVQREQQELIKEQRHPHGAMDPTRRWRTLEEPQSKGAQRVSLWKRHGLVFTLGEYLPGMLLELPAVEPVPVAEDHCQRRSVRW